MKYKELCKELARCRRELADARQEARMLVDREKERHARERDAEQARRREQERADRKKHLTELGEGIVRMLDATEHSLSRDEDGTVRLDLTFRLDDEEHRIVGDNLRYGRPRVDVARDTQERIERMMADYEKVTDRLTLPQRFIVGTGW